MILKSGYQSVSIQFYAACDTRDKISHMHILIYPEKAILEVQLTNVSIQFFRPHPINDKQKTKP